MAMTKDDMRDVLAAAMLPVCVQNAEKTHPDMGEDAMHWACQRAYEIAYSGDDVLDAMEQARGKPFDVEGQG